MDRHISRRRFVGLGAAALLLGGFGSASCSAPQQVLPQGGSAARPGDGEVNFTRPNGSSVRFATGGQAGVYDGWGTQAAAAAFGASGASMLLSDGARANIEALAEGSVDFALCQSDVMNWALLGENVFAGQPVESFSLVVPVYDELLQVVTCDVGIESVAGLKGKRVSLGAPGSGTRLDALAVLEAHGLSEDDVTPTYQTFGDAAKSLEEGRIDAAFFVAGVPTPAISDLFSASEDARLLSLDKRHVRTMTEGASQFSAGKVPAGAYAGRSAEASTVSVTAVLLASEGAGDAERAALAAALQPDAAGEAGGEAEGASPSGETIEGENS